LVRDATAAYIREDGLKPKSEFSRERGSRK
jgi:hypothetical protein